MKKYQLYDIIIFGSSVKSKDKPQDLDLVLITKNKNVEMVGDFKAEIKNIKLDIELLLPEEIYQTRLGYILISEGFSIKNNKFISDLIGVKAQKLYIYEIKELSQSAKVSFGRGLLLIIKKVQGEKLGAGVVKIPLEMSGKFEDFLDSWNLKYKVKEYLIM